MFTQTQLSRSLDSMNTTLFMHYTKHYRTHKQRVISQCSWHVSSQIYTFLYLWIISVPNAHAHSGHSYHIINFHWAMGRVGISVTSLGVSPSGLCLCLMCVCVEYIHLIHSILFMLNMRIEHGPWLRSIASIDCNPSIIYLYIYTVSVCSLTQSLVSVSFPTNSHIGWLSLATITLIRTFCKVHGLFEIKNTNSIE